MGQKGASGLLCFQDLVTANAAFDVVDRPSSLVEIMSSGPLGRCRISSLSSLSLRMLNLLNRVEKNTSFVVVSFENGV